MTITDHIDMDTREQNVRCVLDPKHKNWNIVGENLSKVLEDIMRFLEDEQTSSHFKISILEFIHYQFIRLKTSRSNPALWRFLYWYIKLSLKFPKNIYECFLIQFSKFPLLSVISSLLNEVKDANMMNEALSIASEMMCFAKYEIKLEALPKSSLETYSNFWKAVNGLYSHSVLGEYLNKYSNFLTISLFYCEQFFTNDANLKRTFGPFCQKLMNPLLSLYKINDLSSDLDALLSKILFNDEHYTEYESLLSISDDQLDKIQIKRIDDINTTSYIELDKIFDKMASFCKNLFIELDSGLKNAEICFECFPRLYRLFLVSLKKKSNIKLSKIQEMEMNFLFLLLYVIFKHVKSYSLQLIQTIYTLLLFLLNEKVYYIGSSIKEKSNTHFLNIVNTLICDTLSMIHLGSDRNTTIAIEDVWISCYSLNHHYINQHHLESMLLCALNNNTHQRFFIGVLKVYKKSNQMSTLLKTIHSFDSEKFFSFIRSHDSILIELKSSMRFEYKAQSLEVFELLAERLSIAMNDYLKDVNSVEAHKKKRKRKSLEDTSTSDIETRMKLYLDLIVEILKCNSHYLDAFTSSIEEILWKRFSLTDMEIQKRIKFMEIYIIIMNIYEPFKNNHLEEMVTLILKVSSYDQVACLEHLKLNLILLYIESIQDLNEKLSLFKDIMGLGIIQDLFLKENEYENPCHYKTWIIILAHFKQFCSLLSKASLETFVKLIFSIATTDEKELKNHSSYLKKVILELFMNSSTLEISNLQKAVRNYLKSLLKSSSDQNGIKIFYSTVSFIPFEYYKKLYKRILKRFLIFGKPGPCHQSSNEYLVLSHTVLEIMIKQMYRDHSIPNESIQNILFNEIHHYMFMQESLCSLDVFITMIKYVASNFSKYEKSHAHTISNFLCLYQKYTSREDQLKLRRLLIYSFKYLFIPLQQKKVFELLHHDILNQVIHISLTFATLMSETEIDYELCFYILKMFTLDDKLVSKSFLLCLKDHVQHKTNQTQLLNFFELYGYITSSMLLAKLFHADISQDTVLESIYHHRLKYGVHESYQDVIFNWIEIKNENALHVIMNAITTVHLNDNIDQEKHQDQIEFYIYICSLIVKRHTFSLQMKEALFNLILYLDHIIVELKNCQNVEHRLIKVTLKLFKNILKNNSLKISIFISEVFYLMKMMLMDRGLLLSNIDTLENLSGILVVFVKSKAFQKIDLIHLYISLLNQVLSFIDSYQRDSLFEDLFSSVTLKNISRCFSGLAKLKKRVKKYLVYVISHYFELLSGHSNFAKYKKQFKDALSHSIHDVFAVLTQHEISWIMAHCKSEVAQLEFKTTYQNYEKSYRFTGKI